MGTPYRDANGGELKLTLTLRGLRGEAWEGRTSSVPRHFASPQAARSMSDFPRMHSWNPSISVEGSTAPRDPPWSSHGSGGGAPLEAQNSAAPVRWITPGLPIGDGAAVVGKGRESRGW